MAGLGSGAVAAQRPVQRLGGAAYGPWTESSV